MNFPEGEKNREKKMKECLCIYILRLIFLKAIQVSMIVDDMVMVREPLPDWVLFINPYDPVYSVVIMTLSSSGGITITIPE